MSRKRNQSRLLGVVITAAAFARGVLGDSVLVASGFSNCNTNANITVQKVDIEYNNDNQTVTFDVAGTSNAVQNVTATLNVTAYGNQVYSNSFDPCASGSFVKQLCPVPTGTFSAQGVQAIPSQYANMVPSIAFQIPDIDAQATLQLHSRDTGKEVACISSTVSNGKTASVPAVSYVAAGVAGAALLVTGASAISAAIGGAASGSAGGFGTVSPSFGEVFGWFHGMAMNGMHSVNYPSVYRSFSKNFAFSTGLIPWNSLQMTIDNFRASTGGNLTDDSVQFLQNATLVFPDGSTDSLSSSAKSVKRAFDQFVYLTALHRRDITTSVNTTASTSSNSTESGSTIQIAVKGIQGYVEELSIPSANTFMTVLLIVGIVIAAIAVGILLVKILLEFWALFGSFPKSLTGFRKHYWGSIARAITSLILLLYGVWVLYCIFQFTNGDSWAAKLLAGITLAILTGVLLFFSYKIWSTARKLKKLEGDINGLYEDKSIWVKYSLFYESYKKDYWWIFVPTIIYMFVKGCILAGADGHGMVQTISQLVIESIMLILLLWSRPYERRSGNVINVIIQVVRVLSVVCILVFVEEFGIAQTTQTVAGVVLIAVQSALTGILAILIAWNAINACCKQNPHRRRRKEMEKLETRSMDNLTPLDARNSLLKVRSADVSPANLNSPAGLATEKVPRDTSPDRFVNTPVDEPANPYGGGAGYARAPAAPRNLGPPNTRNLAAPYRPGTPLSPAGPYGNNAVGADRSRDNLIMNAAPIGQTDWRQPTIPDVGMGVGGGSRPGYGGPQGGRAQQGMGYDGRGPYAGGYGRWAGPPSRGGY